MMMEGCGIIVECSVPEEGVSNGGVSCSGMYLGNGLVLTHGTLINDVLRHPAAQHILTELQHGHQVKIGREGWHKPPHIIKKQQIENGKDREHIPLSTISQEKGQQEEYMKKDMKLSARPISLHTGKAAREGEKETNKDMKDDVTSNIQKSNETDRPILNSALSEIKPRFQVIVPIQADTKTTTAILDTIGNPHNKASGQVRTMESVPVPAMMNTPTISPPLNPPLHKSTLSPGHRTFEARLERLFIVPGLRDEIEGLMPPQEGWTFTDDEEGSEKKDDHRFHTLVLSTFALLRVVPAGASCVGVVGPVVSRDGDVAVAAQRMLARSARVGKGATVYVESSPFGSLSPSVFLNSLSRGVVSNTTGPLLLTDARAVLGSEGAPVFTSPRGTRRHCGMVVSPFCWRKGEWVGLTLLAALPPVLHTLLQSCSSSSQSEVPPSLQDYYPVRDETTEQGALVPNSDITLTEKCDQSEEDIVAGVERGVVGVWAGGGWGSGVVVSAVPPLIVTCSHVTTPAASGRVELLLWDGTKVEGRVLHQTRPANPESQQEAKAGIGRCMWDLAVVEASQPLPTALTLATTLPHSGSEVLVAGYGMFSPNRLPSPSVTQGIISRVITAPSSILTWPPSIYAWLRPTLPHPQEITQGYLASDCSHEPNKLSSNNAPEREACNCNCGSNKPVYKRPPSATNRVSSRVGQGTAEPNNTGEVNSSNPLRLEVNKNNSQRTRRVGGGARSVPVMMQTTCTVYAGTSGGPVVVLHPTRGPEVVGVVVCNTRDTINQTTFPHINLAVPSPLLAWVITAYLQSKDVGVLKLLDVECPMVSHLWSLGVLPQHKL
ncbi:hypothetical protein Pmani_020691 [Petrolisthes manimaculis]|uniref:Peroxisomal leader peptide-processing protease n=1 Tax=Petrolisthes manimaculis TaxID=1843537 RepID=A0AAE1PF71_9EUCA|nr:hypothetical protein Pmani_020691 [Petrolisthes manimaculis]